jgi:hypothetical protein
MLVFKRGRREDAIILKRGENWSMIVFKRGRREDAIAF